jgi:Domain of unknown function (DUF4118)
VGLRHTTNVVDRTSSRTGLESVAIVVGPAAALTAAGLFSNVRDDVGTTNVALILATVVVLAAIAGRAAGVVTALFAAASYNFFHTQPYHSLRIHDGKDVATVVLLVAIGLIISGVGAWRRRLGHDARRRLHGEHALTDVAERLAAGDGPDALWDRIRELLVHDLRLEECRYEPRPTTDRPVVGRTGSLPGTSLRLDEHGFALPPDGAAIDVVANARSYGQIVLVPTTGSSGSSGSTSLREQRRVAVALADLFAVALDRADRANPPTATPSRPGDLTS